MGSVWMGFVVCGIWREDGVEEEEAESARERERDDISVA